MPRIDPSFIKHELNVILEAYLVKQRGRRSATEYVDTVIEEVEKLKEVSAITEILYPRKLSNTFMVKKKTSEWRVESVHRCHKSQPSLSKGLLSLAKNWSTCGFYIGPCLMSFLNAYRGYHQKVMHELGQEKIAFITLHGVFYYKVMLFGLKNTRAMYQRIITKMFKYL